MFFIVPTYMYDSFRLFIYFLLHTYHIIVMVSLNVIDLPVPFREVYVCNDPQSRCLVVCLVALISHEE